MSTLLMRLAAPLQSWGISSHFDTRTTERFPSKSGVIGLLAAACGIRRDGDLSSLCALSFGVRVDQTGTLLRDYHIVQRLKSSGKTDTYQTYRYYLADAVFLAGMESEDEGLLQRLDTALRHPAFPLFLGRRSCPPAMPLSLGIRASGLLNALQDEPWQAAAWYQKRWMRQHPDKTLTLRLVTDVLPGDERSAPVQDLPESFSPLRRQYGYRGAVDRRYMPTAWAAETEHDPFEELESDYVPEQDRT